MVNAVNFAQIVDKLGATPKETHVGSTVSDVRDKVNVSVDLNLWERYQDYIAKIPLTESIEERLKKYGDEYYLHSGEFSKLETKSQTMIIEHLRKKYQSMLKRKSAIEKRYMDAINPTEEEAKREKTETEEYAIAQNYSEAETERDLLKLLESLFTGIPIQLRPGVEMSPSYEGPVEP